MDRKKWAKTCPACEIKMKKKCKAKKGNDIIIKIYKCPCCERLFKVEFEEYVIERTILN